MKSIKPSQQDYDAAIRSAQDMNNSIMEMKPRNADLPMGGYYLIVGEKCDITIPASIMHPVFSSLIDMNKEIIDKLIDKSNNINPKDND